MILLIDNYDSFSYNLYQLIGSVNPDVQVVRNDAVSLEEIEKMAPEAIVLSPGPGRPEDAGICIPVIKRVCRQNPNSGRVPWPSEHLRSIWRRCLLRKGIKARQAG